MSSREIEHWERGPLSDEPLGTVSDPLRNRTYAENVARAEAMLRSEEMATAAMISGPEFFGDEEVTRALEDALDDSRLNHL